MRKLSRIIGVTTLMIVATAGPALATRNQPHHQVPFEGSVLALDNGQIFPSPEEPLDCPEWAQWQFFSGGTGKVSHLGRSDLDLIQCSMWVEPPVVGMSEGTTTFVAANGDELYLVHSLTFEVTNNMVPTPDGYVPVPDGFEGEGTWTAVGGSGRFAHATGSGTLSVLGDVPTDDTPMYDLPAGGTLWTFTGMIAYNASNRSDR